MTKNPILLARMAIILLVVTGIGFEAIRFAYAQLLITILDVRAIWAPAKSPANLHHIENLLREARKLKSKL
jgi:hypothetical protein